MEETQLLEKAPAEIHDQPLDEVEQLQRDWPLPIYERQGSDKLLSGIAVWHDFNWLEVIRHPKTIFHNCKRIAARLRSECPQDKIPVLFLTSRDEVKIMVVDNTRYRVVVANVNKVRNAKSATDFFANALDSPLTELIANENLLVVFGARAKQDHEFAAAARGILGRTGTVDRQASVQEALRQLEDCEGIEHDELTQLLTILTKRAGTTRPLALDTVLDSLADEQDVLRWARANQVRWQALLREVFRVEPGACSPTISDVAEYLQTLGPLDDNEAIQLLLSLHESGSGVRRFLAEHMPLVRELAESEYFYCPMSDC